MRDFIKESNYLGHKEFFDSKASHVVFFGGAGSGKSYSVADKFAIETFKNDMCGNIPIKIIVVRKSMPSLKKSCMEILQARFKFWGINYKLNKQESVARIGKNSQIVYISINNVSEIEKIKSITDIDYIWIEEANELLLDAYLQLDLRLRGSRVKYPQLILTLNPVSKASWVYNHLFIENPDKAHKIKVNIETNKYAEKEYIAKLDSYKDISFYHYNVYRLGNWGNLQGIIYENWEISDRLPEKAKIYYGIDFGYSIDPAALVRIYQTSNAFYFEELIYKKKLTNSDLANRILMMNSVNKNDSFFADSAEPKSIEEIYRKGINIKPAVKGPGSLISGIDFLMSQKCYIYKDSYNIQKERDAYCWKVDKNDNTLRDPVDFMNHTLDAIRYGVFTYNRGNLMSGPIKTTAINDYNDPFSRTKR